MRSLLAAMLLVLGVLTLEGRAPILADDASPTAAVAVTSVWSRETPGGATTAAVYATISSKGGADRLVRISSPAAAGAELHSHTMEDGVMKMRPVTGLDVPAGGSVTLAPGGYHVMLVGLVQPLKADATVPLTFTFEKAGPIAVEAKVQAINAAAPAGDTAEHHHH